MTTPTRKAPHTTSGGVSAARSRSMPVPFPSEFGALLSYLALSPIPATGWARGLLSGRLDPACPTSPTPPAALGAGRRRPAGRREPDAAAAVGTGPGRWREPRRVRRRARAGGGPAGGEAGAPGALRREPGPGRAGAWQYRAACFTPTCTSTRASPAPAARTATQGRWHGGRHARASRWSVPATLP